MSAPHMSKNRLEAFSDGVIAIIITIMVLEIRMPHGATLASLSPLVPVFLSYVLSFVYIAIYWNNHHHMMQAVHQVSGRVLWANMHLLFWLSIVPAVTAWMGENHYAATPAALYGAVLFMAGLAYFILARELVAIHEKSSPLAVAIGSDRKGLISIVIYAIAIPLAFLRPWMAFTLYVAVAIIWFVPDTRIEKALG